MRMFEFGIGWSRLLGPVVLALIAYAIYYAVTRPSRKIRSARYQSQNPLEILKERYTKGEITME